MGDKVSEKEQPVGQQRLAGGEREIPLRAALGSMKKIWLLLYKKNCAWDDLLVKTLRQFWKLSLIIIAKIHNSIVHIRLSAEDRFPHIFYWSLEAAVWAAMWNS